MGHATTGRGVRLTRFQRILVGTDGTVTNLLEAYAGEPVEARKLRQIVDASDDRDCDLDLPAGGKVLRREVILRGAHSDRPLLHADAVIALGRVDPVVVDGLLTTDTPLGRLLAEGRTETFREILHVDQERAGAVGVLFGVDAGCELIARTYRLVAGGRPAALVRERFPTHFFRELTD